MRAASHLPSQRPPTLPTQYIAVASPETNDETQDIIDWYLQPSKPLSHRTDPHISPEHKQKRDERRRARYSFLAAIPAVVAGLGKALKDGFGAMTLYALIAYQSLKLTGAILNPWIVAVVAFLGVSLFLISVGMEGKSLHHRILNAFAKKMGFENKASEQQVIVVNGAAARARLYLQIGLLKALRHLAPWTAATCKGISGMGSTAGCLLMLAAAGGVIATASLTGVIPWVFLGFSAIVGLTQGLVSRYKEGDEFIKEAYQLEFKLWRRLGYEIPPETLAKVSPVRPLELPLTHPDYDAKTLETKRSRAQGLAWIPGVIAALGRAMKDGFGAMALYALIAIGSLKMTGALLSPAVIVAVGFLGISLFFVSIGMEGKALRDRILVYMSRQAGVNLSSQSITPPPAKGLVERAKLYLVIGGCKLTRIIAPTTSAICKAISGAGSITGCLLMILAATGVIATTTLGGTIPAIVLAVSCLFGINLGLVSRYKEGDDLIKETIKLEVNCWQRLVPSTDKAHLKPLRRESYEQIRYALPPKEFEVSPPAAGAEATGQAVASSESSQAFFESSAPLFGQPPTRNASVLLNTKQNSPQFIIKCHGYQ